MLPQYYGELGEQLGSLREIVKKRILDSEDRKACFEALLRCGKERGRTLAPGEVEEILLHFSGRTGRGQ